MRQLKAVHTMVSSPQVTARWARKAPSRTEHYKRRTMFYFAEVLKMVAVVIICYLIAYGSLKLMFGE